MIARPLILRSCEGARRPVAALLLSGSDPTEWLAELTAGDAALSGHELYRLPGEGGLCALRPANAAAPTGRGLRFGRLGRHLLLPVEAEVHPPISEAEADQLFGRWHLVVWHPVLGACGFDREDALALRDLLAPPRDRRAPTWNAAQAGPEPLPALRAIQVALPARPEEIFGESAKDIGSDPVQPDAAKLPPRPEEPPSDPASGLARGAKLFAFQALAKLLEGVPRTASQPTWINSVEDWLGRRMGGMMDQLDRLRHRAIDRLLRELEENPDKGLRHAIPLGSLPGAAARGMAPPSALLGNRAADFRLNDLFASGSADQWALDAARQERLRALYHELAQREIQLGRHRRAAYIFAHLLRDLNSAASTLLSGGHFREAAVLYRDHLHNPALAAQALESGGLLDEALVLYESLQDWRSLARLHRERGDLEAMRRALRREVDRLLALPDRRAAARVLEAELGAPREAADLLVSAWPSGPAAGECLCELFVLLARENWPAETEALLVRLRGETLSEAQAVVLVDSLAAVRKHQLTLPLCAAVAEVAFARIGQHLSAATGSVRRALAESLTRLAPDDRLLGRDVHRFLAGAPVAPPPLPLVAQGRRRIEFLSLSRKDQGLGEVVAAASADGYVVAGQQGDNAIVVRYCPWEGTSASVTWQGPSQNARPALIVDLHERQPIIVMHPGRPASFLMRRPFPGHQLLVGTPTWWPEDAGAATYQNGDLIILREVDGADSVVSFYSAEGRLAGTRPLPSLVREMLSPPVLAAHASGPFALGVGELLVILHRSGEVAPQRLVLQHRVLGLCATTKFARAGFLVVTSDAVLLLWVGQAKPLHVADTRGGRLLAAFTLAGSVVVLDQQGGRVFEVGLGGAPAQIAEFGAEFAVAVTAGPERDEFAVFHLDGGVGRYRIGR